MSPSLGSDDRPRSSLTEYVYNSLCRALLRGDYPPGHSLPSEGELAAQFDVSKVVIRAALQQLAALGVVEIRQGRACLVKRLSPRPLEYFFSFALMETDNGLVEAVQLRRGLETYIAERAAQHIKMSELVQLRQALKTMEKARANPEAFVEADIAFHMALVDASDNRLLMFLMHALKGTIRETIRMLHAKGVTPDRSATIARHAAIVEAIGSGDPAAARQAMSDHFDASEAKTLAMRPNGKPALEPERIIEMLERGGEELAKND
ncbi:MAG: FadR family transcriptional regulator [Chelatococcus sp.]|jgi:GntR family transcriptional repressor for pyruvate dehydrogenase complex|uniref:FadR/GntR family transcriptional regulator n=1 Tax=unclassified Chelatococcus TaxID=2638111 RepID=UPI001BCBFEE2|nr:MULTISPECIES: FadR/GntR family transcriptional regulator [unclassified Chelatococcus]CAH1657657.1 FadR family transcriptional regulator [Hyphomicrobiales bacterium]MBS7742280.1 FadR family transcriptional regulator [Chelatococcus sp. HY11]MBX3537451.1 FadR family transcriptional regulator [Chelatococcus sp.]MBX3542602.1 FadR family transcriptional regulator [Chelatococcus sp.]MCO5075181.1 FadR family transcriptional regulator [Chelatococcus sp.]